MSDIEWIPSGEIWLISTTYEGDAGARYMKWFYSKKAAIDFMTHFESVASIPEKWVPAQGVALSDHSSWFAFDLSNGDEEKGRYVWLFDGIEDAVKEFKFRQVSEKFAPLSRPTLWIKGV